MVYAIIAVVLVVILIAIGAFKYFNNKKKKDVKPKVKKEKVKPVEKPKVEKVEGTDKIELKGSYVDLVDKYLFRKEFKLLVLVSRVLPKGFIAFPKVGADQILESVGNKALYNSVVGKYIDIVIFEEATMRPRLAVDIFDGSVGDEQLDVESPELVEALKNAELPMVSFRVKTEYAVDEIKNPILKALGTEGEIDPDANKPIEEA